MHVPPSRGAGGRGRCVPGQSPDPRSLRLLGSASPPRLARKERGHLSAVFTVGAPVYYPATRLPSPYLGVVLPTGAAAVIIQDSAGLIHYGPHLTSAAAVALALQSALGLYFLFKLARWRQP